MSLTFVVSAPAGSGKTTLVNRLKQEMPRIKETVSCTTRSPRVNEVDGVDYHFISKEQFQKAIEHNEFLEWVMLYDDYYGTLTNEIARLHDQGNHAILVIDTQGACKLKSKLDAIFIFISPPSLEELRRRLESRGTESSASIEKRLKWAVEELQKIPFYDYHIINDNLDVAFDALCSIIIAEECRIRSKI